MPANKVRKSAINIFCFIPGKIFFITYFLVKTDTVTGLLNSRIDVVSYEEKRKKKRLETADCKPLTN
jgi:hypothetical protein